MPYIVADPCIKCKYTDCVAVCPVDCFYEGANMLVIHPDECIDCGACEPECPVNAIFEEESLPAEWAPYTSINSVYSGAIAADEASIEGWPRALIEAVERSDFASWPNISEPKEALPEADAFAQLKGKLADLSPAPGTRK